MEKKKPNKARPKKKSSSNIGDKLTARMQRFCEEYVKDLNATQAAIRAGYSIKTANSIAGENLAKPSIQSYVKELQAEIRERNKITIDEIVQNLAAFLRFDIATIMNEDGSMKNLSDMPEEARKCIAGLESMEINGFDGPIGVLKKVKLSSKLTAADMLLKHLGGYEKDNEQKKQDIQTVVVLPSNGRES